MVEERVVESADGMSVTMEATREALTFCICNRCPFISSLCVRMTEVTLQEELQILSASHGLARIIEIQRLMTSNCFTICQVDEVLKQIETVLAAATIIVDIDLRLAFHILMIDIVVVALIIHHLLQIMVVGHIQLHRIRIGSAKTGLCIVGNPIVVLIPIERCLVIKERCTVIVRGGIVIVGEDFPS